MNNEFVGLSHSQKVYGKKNLLYCEMGLLETIRRHERYKKFRKQELGLKEILKKLLHDLKEEIRRLDNILPKVKHPKYRPAEISTVKRKRKDLELEIEDIKQKIADLQEY